MDQTARQILSVIGTSSSCAMKKKQLAPLSVCLFAEKLQPSRKDDMADSEKNGG